MNKQDSERAASSVISIVLLTAVLILSFSIGALGIIDFFERNEDTVESDVTYRESLTGVFVGVADVDNELLVYSDDTLVQKFDSNDRGERVFIRLEKQKEISAVARTENKEVVVSKRRFKQKYSPGCLLRSSDDSFYINYNVEDKGGSGTVGNSLNEVNIDDTNDSFNFNNVQRENVTVKLEEPYGTVNATDDIDGVSSSPSYIAIGLSGNYNVTSDSNVLVSVDGVDIPDNPGEYDTSVEINGDVSRTCTLYE